MTDQRKGNWMMTYSGQVYWPVDPRPEEVRIEDIAHSLAHQCRYGGHACRFYSVAEHCVILSRMVPGEDALQALLHDATEAYVVDVPRPLKPFLENYQNIEWLNRVAICRAFDLQTELPESVKDLDHRAPLAEMRRVMPWPLPLPHGIEGETPNMYLELLAPLAAKEAFLERFDELWAKREAKLHPAAYHKQRRAA